MKLLISLIVGYLVGTVCAPNVEIGLAAGLVAFSVTCCVWGLVTK